jgi:hypothetical protein
MSSTNVETIIHPLTFKMARLSTKKNIQGLVLADLRTFWVLPTR